MFVIIGILVVVVVLQQIRINYWKSWWFRVFVQYDNLLDDFDLAAASLYDITGIDIRS